MGATVTLERTLDWIDTDAAGYWHHSTLWRFVEAAEARMHRDLGIVGITFGFTPRRHLEAEFFAPLHFDRPATITLGVAGVGRTSATYEARLASGDQVVATARIVVVFITADGAKRPWPDEVRRALLDGVPIDPGVS